MLWIAFPFRLECRCIKMQHAEQKRGITAQGGIFSSYHFRTRISFSNRAFSEDPESPRKPDLLLQPLTFPQNLIQFCACFTARCRLHAFHQNICRFLYRIILCIKGFFDKPIRIPRTEKGYPEFRQCGLDMEIQE